MSKSLGDFKIPSKARVQLVVIVPKASQKETTQNKARDFIKFTQKYKVYPLPILG